MKTLTAAAFAAIAALGLAASPTPASALPNAAWEHQPAHELLMRTQYRSWEDDRRWRGGGRPRVVCRIVEQRVFDPRIGRPRIIEREVCRQRGPRW